MASSATHAIKILAPLPAPAWGGLHAVIATIHPFLRRDGYEVHPVVPDTSRDLIDRFQACGIEAVPLDLSRIRRTLQPAQHWRFLTGLLRDPKAMAALARRTGASIFQLAGLQHVQGALASRQAGTALVWQIHSDLLPPVARRVLTPFARKVSDSIMVNGPQVRQAFPGLALYPPERVFEFRAPINTDHFAFTGDQRQAARRLLGADEADVIIGTIGNQTHQKAHERLVALALELGEQSPARIVILGGETASNRAYYRKEVIQPAEAAGLFGKDRLRIIDAGAKVRDYLPAFDIFAMPSRAEGIPVALLEAMASGLPVIISDVGSVREAVTHGETGFLVEAEPFDEAGFARHIRGLVKDAGLRERLGQAARQAAKSRFSAETVAKAHGAAYQRALDERAKRMERHG